MDRFSVKVLLLDQTDMTLLCLVLFVIGGVLGSVLFTVRFSLRRVSYLWWFALINLALALSLGLWAFVPVAEEAGQISILVASGLAVFVAYGAALYVSSAARSNHIAGNTGKAWLAFVPLAILWLMFKGGSAGTGAARRPALARYVLDPVLVCLALLTLSVAQGVINGAASEPAYSLSDSPALQRIRTRAQSLEESFATEARLTRPALPLRINEITILRDVEADGATLRLTYDVERDIGELGESFRLLLAQDQCSSRMYGIDLARGGRIVTTYIGPTGRQIATYRITHADCP